MKIIVLNSGDFHVEAISVPDHLVNDGQIEEFLQKEYYPLNNFSWMAGHIDCVPVAFHDYAFNEDNGEVTKTCRKSRLNNFSIYDTVQEVKHREREKLRASIRQYGEYVDNGYEYHFEGNCPIIAAYSYDEPCDIVILSVRIDKDGVLTIRGDDKLDRGNEFELDPDNIFAGQLEFVTSNIV